MAPSKLGFAGSGDEHKPQGNSVQRSVDSMTLGPFHKSLKHNMAPLADSELAEADQTELLCTESCLHRVVSKSICQR